MRYCLWICMLVFVACKSNEKTPDAFTEKDVVFTFERTACFGTCPEYKLTVYHTGEALFEGRKNTQWIGTYTCEDCERQMIAKILQTATDIKFWDMQDKYDPGVTDLPSTITMINTQAEPKTVVNVLDGPASLKELESLIDDLYLQRKWIKKD